MKFSCIKRSERSKPRRITISPTSPAREACGAFFIMKKYTYKWQPVVPRQGRTEQSGAGPHRTDIDKATNRQSRRNEERLVRKGHWNE